MPIGYYIIPMVSGPYSRENPQRPAYVDEIQCNWTGHPVAALGVYVCLVNTSDAKHADLDGRAGVRSLPRNATWDTAVLALPAVARNRISAWCTAHGVPYDASETLGQLLMRVINSDLAGFGATPLATPHQDLTPAQRDKIATLCQRLNLTPPAETETVRQLSDRVGPHVWPGDDNTRVYVEEF